MKSTLIILILALACGYGLYTQYVSKEKQSADAHTRTKTAEAEIAALTPAFEKAKARFEERSKVQSDTEANMPEAEYKLAVKAEEASLAAAKAALAEELAKTVPDPPMPPAAAETLATNEKELAEDRVRLDKIEAENVIMRKYAAAETAAMPKSARTAK